MQNIYIPNYSNNKCAIIYNQDTIRVYDTRPNSYNVDYYYTDYYINSNYLEKRGVSNFNQYNGVPTCLSNDLITTEVYYRNDFDKIMIITFILIILLLYFPFKIVSRTFGRWAKF